ncbi:sulfatase-like hydrolase/transferase [Agromyces marinus]|uniref:sulfatase-like hydrolase/transferase n=2 Tax=Agromyces marinus TaxID=1389020 RepID=UPI002DD42EDC|nr:sulfatase-like hydrolase/transferase [Agromyces marinus]UIP58381.1 Ulvan-active sulfatase [Agromyces marinus]
MNRFIYDHDAPAPTTGSPRRPNLVFIFSDQQSRDMLGAYGLSDVKTPHLDRLAERGLLFDHAVSNSPVCTPARSMLISGVHPLWNNCFTNDRRLATDLGDSFAEVTRRHGYRNGYVGKWHLYGGDRNRPIPAGPDRHGFDDEFLSNNCAVNYDPDNSFFWDGDEKVHFGCWEVEGQTDQALRFIENQSVDDPFTLFVSYHAPHNHNGGDDAKYTSFDAPDEFKDLYDPDALTLRPTVPVNERTRLMTQGYLALCSEVDANVGRVIAALDERGVRENTIIVYTSDHGETFGAFNNHWHKSSPEDVSARVPLIMSIPGQVRARTSELIVGTIDLMPTLLGLMGLDVPEHVHGKDLSAAIRDEDDDVVESAPLFYFTTPWRGVYTKEWTYSTENIDRTDGSEPHAESDVGRTVLLRRMDTLFRRSDDTHQLDNHFGRIPLPGVPGTAEVQARLHAKLEEWLAYFEDPFPNQRELWTYVVSETTPPIHRMREMSPLIRGPLPR